MQSFDYVIIGGGSAGCVLANRLSARPENRVLLLDAGRPDTNPLLSVPLACGLFFFNPGYTWGMESDPEPSANGRRIPAIASRVLGGGSSINGMIYTRGDPLDYDQWAQVGASGWSYSDVLPYFKRSERSWRGAGDHHGADGPLGVSPMVRDATFASVIETARNLGHTVTEDFEAGVLEGFGVPDVTVGRGRRSSTSQTFLRPVRRRRNLSIVSGAAVTRIVVEKGRATGVEYIRGGKKEAVHSDREIVLSAGAYLSPKLMMLSGIGPADHLRSVGVDVQVDLPFVGRNLQDHAKVSQVYQSVGPVRFDQNLRLDRLVRNMIRWRISGDGPATDSPASAFAFLKTRPGLERADVEWTLTGAYKDSHMWFPGWRKPARATITVANVLLRPESRGEVLLRSSDPFAPPRLHLNMLSTRSDCDTLLRSLRMTREFMRSAPMCHAVSTEIAPGNGIDGDADLLEYMRNTVLTNIHPTSTCAMGTGPTAVVNSELKVFGVDGLRVADASVMPLIPGAHTNAPTIMIAEKAADLILNGAPAG